MDLPTKVDKELYRAGLLRLVREVRAVELEAKARIIFPRHLEILRPEVGYLPGLWEEVHGIPSDLPFHLFPE